MRLLIISSATTCRSRPGTGAGSGRYLRVQRPSSVSYQQPLGRRSRDFAA